MLAVQADGHEILTVEGIAPSPDKLHPLQEAFRDNHGLQCGFCTPGMLTTLIEFLRDNPDPTEQEVRIGISGNFAVAPVTRASCGRTRCSQAPQGRAALAADRSAKYGEIERLSRASEFPTAAWCYGRLQKNQRLLGLQ